MNKQRGELSLLQRDVDAAQKAYETVSASSAQARLQSYQPDQRDAPGVGRGALDRPARRRAGPADRPRGGMLLAIAGTLLLELANRRVRSAEDLSLVTQLPILATVPASAVALCEPCACRPRAGWPWQRSGR